MKRSTLAYAIALNQTKLLGPSRFKKLVSLAGSIPAIFDPEFLSNLEGSEFPKSMINALQAPDWEAVEETLNWQSSADNHIINLGHPLYPKALEQLTDAPTLLYVIGEPALLSQPQIAIVGSRKPSKYGESATAHLAKSLSQENIIITSGLAYGIDGIAHLATVQEQKPTIAVMGRGLEKIYPARHTKLAENILLNNGALVSEFPLKTEPLAQNFPRRNRIISGMSLGTVVIEAQIKSGSLITAKLAADQGKEVFAVPGSIFNPLSSGCHHLIQQGAKLIQSAEDVIEEIQFQPPPSQGFYDKSGQRNPKSPQIGIDSSKNNHTNDDKDTAPADKKYRDCLAIIGFDPIAFDEIHRLSGLTIAELSAMLLDLELEDWIAKDAGGSYQRIR